MDEAEEEMRAVTEGTMRERIVSELTGEGEPPIVIRLFHGEAHALMRLLAEGRDVTDPTTEIGHVWTAVTRQIHDQWGNPPRE